MLQIAGTVLAFAAAAAFVWGIWSIAERLTQRGIIVRPVSMMDKLMTDIERRHAAKAKREDVAAEQ